MTNKQIQKLDEFHQEMLLSEMDQLLMGSKFINGQNHITVFDIPHDLWFEIVQKNDYPSLWQDANKYLENI